MKDNLLDETYIGLEVNSNNFIELKKYIISMIKPSKYPTYNICFVCDLKYIQNKMSRVRFWAIENLGKNKKINLSITGPGFQYFDKNKSLQENVLFFFIKFDLVIWYKPLNENYNFKKDEIMPFKTCLRYNEMWDKRWTKTEIEDTLTDIIICHHKNDYLNYSTMYKNDNSKKFYYIPHHAKPEIFRKIDNSNQNKDIDILISGIVNEKHYPFKYRIFNLIKNNPRLKKYNIVTHKHPNYSNNISFLNVNQIEYNEIINKSKLCLACTSRYNYRLGKYVEIPMAGSLILGDLPFEEKDEFKKFIINIENDMSDDDIINTIIYNLENYNSIKYKEKIGIEWSKNHTTENYVNKFIDQILKNL